MPILFRKPAAALLTVFVLTALPALAQKVAGEVLLSPTGTGPTATADGRGGFVLAWVDQNGGGSSNVLAALLPKGAQQPRAPFVVNTTTGFQVNPSVAADTGRFVVVWQDGKELGQIPTTGGSRVLGQSFDMDGGRQSSEIRLSHAEVGQQVRPQVTVETNGSFAATWIEMRLPRAAIKAAHFSAGGSPLGPEVDMQAAGDDDVGAQVAAFRGGFAVGWSEYYWCPAGQPIGLIGAVARFDAGGRHLGAVYRMGTSQCSSPDAIVLFALLGSRAGALAVFASSRNLIQRFAPSGAPVGGPFLLPDPPCGGIRCAGIATVAMDGFGRFAVIWEVTSSEGFSLAAQLFNPRGKPLTGLVPVSGLPSTTFKSPAAALADDGTLAVVWRRENFSHPESDGLFLRRLSLP